MTLHQPVLLQEVIDGFAPVDLNSFIDGTLGAGGHTGALLAHHPELTKAIGIDRDSEARALAAKNLSEYKDRLIIKAGNFREAPEILHQLDRKTVDGILLDLGVSSMQLDQKERGFSFSKEGPLDMRMDKSQPLLAETIVNEWSEEKLAEILELYGEIKRPQAVVRALLAARQKERITTTHELVEITAPYLRAPRGGKVHPATLFFQALRIAVNDELGVLDALPQLVSLLNQTGRMGVITFHSLEDRIVKNTFKQMASRTRTDPTNPYSNTVPQTPTVRLINKKPILPSKEEMRRNRRSRSAKLRLIEKL